MFAFFAVDLVIGVDHLRGGREGQSLQELFPRSPLRQLECATTRLIVSIWRSKLAL
jgi:hypothetical protein